MVNTGVKGGKRTELTKRIKAIILENNMLHYYNTVSPYLKDIKLTAAQVTEMEVTIEKTLTKFDEDIKDSKENLGDIEVLDLYKKKLMFSYYSKPEADTLKVLEELNGLKGISTGQKIDNCLLKLRLGLFFKDFGILESTIEEIDKFLEVGGDWERRNRFKVYKGLYYILKRNFKQASENFIPTISTFTSTELMSYKEFLKYCIYSASISLNRVEFKEKIIDSAPIKAILTLTSTSKDKNLDSEGDKYLAEFVMCLYNQDYATYFLSISKIYENLVSDRYFYDHLKYWLRELRIKTYKQFLEPYKSVTLDMMGYEFGVSKEFLDRELSRFISSGKISAKINKIDGIIEANKQTEEHMKYQEVIKEGDLMLNKIQVLSRLLGV